jgi:two-component system, OmpR family, sensor histidine kinase MprB
MRFRNVSFRARLALVAAGAVALAIVAASAVAFVVVRGELQREFDKTLTDRAQSIPAARIDPGGELEIGPPGFGGFVGYVQAVRADGRTFLTANENVKLPVNDAVRAVAKGERNRYFSDANVDGTDLRILTVPAGNQFALQIARASGDLEHTLHRLAVLLVVISLGGIAVALGLGLGVAQAALAPVRRLTMATERVTATGDLSERISGSGEDELSRLASSFNTMLAALEESARSQRQLVSDASHELRTPLTSLRTNIEVLARDREMPAAEREHLLNDVVSQLSEMTALINELVELARGETHHEEPEDVRLDLLVGEVLERARRDYPHVDFVAELEPTELHGVPSTIARAVSNLLDNAAKWSPAEGKVEVAVRDGQVVVRDHGPGIDDTDLPYVFDRFYRAPTARKLPGSGLGLAIVKQVAEAHGGAVVAERVDGGGTRMRLRLCDSNGNGRA